MPLRVPSKFLKITPFEVARAGAGEDGMLLPLAVGRGYCGEGVGGWVDGNQGMNAGCEVGRSEDKVEPGWGLATSKFYNVSDWGSSHPAVDSTHSWPSTRRSWRRAPGMSQQGKPADDQQRGALPFRTYGTASLPTCKYGINVPLTKPNRKPLRKGALGTIV